MFLPPRVRSTRPISRHAQRPAATATAGETVLLCGNEDRQSKLRTKKNEDSRTAALIVIYQDIA